MKKRGQIDERVNPLTVLSKLKSDYNILKYGTNLPKEIEIIKRDKLDTELKKAQVKLAKQGKLPAAADDTAKAANGAIDDVKPKSAFSKAADAIKYPFQNKLKTAAGATAGFTGYEYLKDPDAPIGTLVGRGVKDVVDVSGKALGWAGEKALKFGSDFAKGLEEPNTKTTDVAKSDKTTSPKQPEAGRPSDDGAQPLPTRGIGFDQLRERSLNKVLDKYELFLNEESEQEKKYRETREKLQRGIYGQESDYGKAKTNKPNYAGALGPMQIMPGTFNGMKKSGLIPKDYDINNPEHNRAAGNALIAHYYDKYKGDPAKVAAAYYAGPKAVNKDGTINTHYRDRKNPKAPDVGKYIDQTLGKAGIKDVTYTAAKPSAFSIPPIAAALPSVKKDVKPRTTDIEQPSTSLEPKSLTPVSATGVLSAGPTQVAAIGSPKAVSVGGLPDFDWDAFRKAARSGEDIDDLIKNIDKYNIPASQAAKPSEPVSAKAASLSEAYQRFKLDELSAAEQQQIDLAFANPTLARSQVQQAYDTSTPEKRAEVKKYLDSKGYDPKKTFGIDYQTGSNPPAQDQQIQPKGEVNWDRASKDYYDMREKKLGKTASQLASASQGQFATRADRLDQTKVDAALGPGFKAGSREANLALLQKFRGQQPQPVQPAQPDQSGQGGKPGPTPSPAVSAVRGAENLTPYTTAADVAGTAGLAAVAGQFLPKVGGVVAKAVPGLNVAYQGADALRRASIGDTTGSAISAAGAVPVLGIPAIAAQAVRDKFRTGSFFPSDEELKTAVDRDKGVAPTPAATPAPQAATPQVKEGIKMNKKQQLQQRIQKLEETKAQLQERFGSFARAGAKFGGALKSSDFGKMLKGLGTDLKPPADVTRKGGQTFDRVRGTGSSGDAMVQNRRTGEVLPLSDIGKTSTKSPAVWRKGGDAGAATTATKAAGAADDVAAAAAKGGKPLGRTASALIGAGGGVLAGYGLGKLGGDDKPQPDPTPTPTPPKPPGPDPAPRPTPPKPTPDKPEKDDPFDLRPVKPSVDDTPGSEDWLRRRVNQPTTTTDTTKPTDDANDLADKYGADSYVAQAMKEDLDDIKWLAGLSKK